MLEKTTMDKKGILFALMATSVLLFAVPSIGILPAHALCGIGNGSDSWTSGSGATITVTDTACPGTNPRHTTTCSADPNIVVDSGSAELSAVDNVQPNTGTRYDNTYSIGCGSSFSKTFGPFSGDAVPNCAYTEYVLSVHDSVTGENHSLDAFAYGQIGGICQV
jgi:hypothetical protein